MPLVTEEIYLGLTGAGAAGDAGDADSGPSVHLTDWPDVSTMATDPELVDTMDRVRAVCSTALNLREERRLRTRLPLAKLVVAGPDAAVLAPFASLIQSEINVKSVEFADDASAFGSEVLKPNAKVLGPRIGKAVAAGHRRSQVRGLDEESGRYRSDR